MSPLSLLTTLSSSPSFDSSPLLRFHPLSLSIPFAFSFFFPVSTTMAVKEASNTIVEINNLRFTYLGINDQPPPPKSTPLIDHFSLTLNSGNCCLLIRSNGTTTSSKISPKTSGTEKKLLVTSESSRNSLLILTQNPNLHCKQCSRDIYFRVKNLPIAKS